MNYYVKEKIENIKNEMEIAIAEKAAWENVKTVTKKDGSQFKNFSQNFTGCKIEIPAWACYAYEKKMTVSFMVKYAHHTASISLYEQNYGYTVGDAMKAVNNHISYLEKQISDMEKAINKADDISDYIEKIKSDLQKMEDRNMKEYYAVIDILHRIY